MDFRRIYPGEEPRVSNPDLMYMQYNNYFAIHGITKGLDKDNVGVIINGCNVTINYNYGTATATVSLGDGYIGINGKMVKCEDTSDISFTVNYSAPTATYYLFAEPELGYNANGDKLYVNNVSRRTWEETRVKLSYASTPTITGNKILLGQMEFYVETQSYIFYRRINDIGENLIASNSIDNVNDEGRLGKTNKVVSGNNLYDVMGDWYIKSFTSSSKIILGDTTRYYFSIPDDITGLYMIGASLKLVGGEVTSYIGPGTIVDENANVWYWHPNENLLSVGFVTKNNVGDNVARVKCLLSKVSSF